jgi:GNAT superfamily N-acetyltransferase
MAADLVNSAYRGETSKSGWTTEANILDGLRTDEETLRALIAQPNNVFLLGFRAAELACCVHLERKETGSCYLGMLTVNPKIQAIGIGRKVMAAAENFAQTEFGAKSMEMTVITLRTELLDWYVRRGYVRTGRKIAFPVHERFGVLKVPVLEMEILEKEF